MKKHLLLKYKYQYNETNVHRLGLIYFGFGSYKIGYNSEAIRAGIQNTWHVWNNYKLWDKLNTQYPGAAYWYHGSTGGCSLWY